MDIKGAHIAPETLVSVDLITQLVKGQPEFMHTDRTDPKQQNVLASIRLYKCDIVAEALDHFSKGLVVGSNTREETIGALTPEVSVLG